MNFILVFIGGGIGSALRYLMSNLTVGIIFPYGTLIINFFASLILAVLFAYFETNTDISEHIKLMLTVGFCGGLSTFSTFAFESFTLYHSNGLRFALIYSVASVLLCVLAIFIGIKLINNQLI